jgi:hypothetical protein
VSGEICEQEWSIGLNTEASPPVCDFTGDWNLNFTFGCEPSLVAANTCPLPLVNGVFQAPGMVSFHLTTESFCPTVFADVRLSASLTSFQDANHAILKDNFLSGATAYFVASVSSPDATIVEVKMLTVRSELPSFGITTLYQNPGIDVPSIVVTDFPRNPTVSAFPTQSHFSLILDSTTFPVNVDSSQGLTISCTLEVVFANTGLGGGTHTRQLSVLFANVLAAENAGNSPVDAAAAVVLGSVGLNSGASSTVFFSVVLVAALALVQLMF